MPRARGLGGGKQLAHMVEQAGVRRQVGTRRASDRPLVDLHQAPHALHAGDDAAAHIAAARIVERRLDHIGVGLGDGRALSQLRQHQLNQRLAHQA